MRVILGVVLILIAVLVTALVAVLILVVVLISVLVVHCKILQYYICGMTAPVVCPFFQDLSFGLKIKLMRSPAVMAAVMPPAAAFNPPVKTPRKPSCAMASRTPLARV